MKIKYAAIGLALTLASGLACAVTDADVAAYFEPAEPDLTL